MGRDRPVALVTGASRGIGKATAVALATAGFDVVVTARTLHRSDAPAEPSGRSDRPLPGSLEETVEAIAEAGGTGWPVMMDLSDRDRLVQVAQDALDVSGGVDVLVNNAIWTGPGNYSRFLDTDVEHVVRRIEGNLVAQLLLTQPILASMVGRGGGVILNVTSGAAYARPFAQPGEGGWGLGYAVSKAGFHRMAEQIAFEYGGDGVVALNVQPGFVATERVKLVRGPVANVAARGAEPAVIGTALAHVAVHAGELVNGSTVQLPEIARSLGLLQARP